MPEAPRLSRICRRAVAAAGLDLGGAVVLTEAASGAFVITPVLAALAGARRVYALSADSAYGSQEEVRRQTVELARACAVEGAVEVVGQREAALIGQADIVTNLGFVRPLDEGFVAAMKPGACIAYMCEAWEWRPGDVDLAACARRGVPVMATDEGRCGVLSALGPLAAKMLFELDVDVWGSQVAILSGDRFGPAVAGGLRSMGATAEVFATGQASGFAGFISGCDALVLADYRAERPLIGQGAQPSAAELARLAPGLVVAQLTGGADWAELAAAGLRAFPARRVEPLRMGCSFAFLGCAPVAALHAAGLKVGEAMWRAALLGLSGASFTAYVLEHSPAQTMDGRVSEPGASRKGQVLG